MRTSAFLQEECLKVQLRREYSPDRSQGTSTLNNIFVNKCINKERLSKYNDEMLEHSYSQTK